MSDYKSARQATIDTQVLFKPLFTSPTPSHTNENNNEISNNFQRKNNSSIISCHNNRVGSNYNGNPVLIRTLAECDAD